MSGRAGGSLGTVPEVPMRILLALFTFIHAPAYLYMQELEVCRGLQLAVVLVGFSCGQFIC